MEKHKKRWMTEIEELNINLRGIRAALEKMMTDQNTESIGAIRERRYIGRLEAFGQWLDEVCSGMIQVEIKFRSNVNLTRS